MADHILRPEALDGGARLTAALAAAGTPALDVVFWLQRMDGWVLVIATAEADERPTQAIHADIDAVRDSLAGIDAIFGLGEPVLVFAPSDPPAAAARGALDHPATGTRHSVPVSTLLGDIVVYDHRALARAGDQGGAS